jgi:hypothetical protein
LGVRHVADGWMGTYPVEVVRRHATALAPGAVHEQPAKGIGNIECMRSVGGCVVTIQCSWHLESAGRRVARHAVRQTLALLGIAPFPLMPGDPSQWPFECLTLITAIKRTPGATASGRPGPTSMRSPSASWSP